MIRPVSLATKEDVAAIVRIYNHYIENTIITFEEETISADEMASRVSDITQTLPFLVWEENGVVLGYAYAGKWKTRAAYRYAVETSIYLDPAATGKGIGSRLYAALVAELRLRNIHTVIRSVALHEKFGFVKVAHFKEVGRKFGAWIDVAYWQLNLEAAE